MSRAEIIIRSGTDRARALALLAKCDWNTRVTFKASKRSIPQNDIIHAMCTDIARQLVWHGQKWPMEDWKKNLVACFKADLRLMPRADGFGVVPVGGTSDLTKEEAGDFITFIEAWGAEHGVTFHDPKAEAA